MIYNKIHQVNYTTKYISFIKDLGFANSDTMKYNVINSLNLANFL